MEAEELLKSEQVKLMAAYASIPQAKGQEKQSQIWKKIKRIEQRIDDLHKQICKRKNEDS